MSKALKWRVLVVLAVIIVVIYYIYPTIKLSGLSEVDKAKMTSEEIRDLQKRAIHLGLDLRGGMHLVLEVDKSKIEKEADISNIVDRAEMIIRNRIDRFGIAEPVVQKEGQTRLVVQLAGITDQSRAKELIGQTALLEFKLVKEGDEFRKLLSNIDEALSDEIAALTEHSENIDEELKRLASEMDTTGLRQEMEGLTGKQTLSSMIELVRIGTHEDALVDEQSIPFVKRVFELAEAKNLIPPDVEILWSRDKEQGREGKFQRVYLVKRKAEITGQFLSSAIVRWGLDPQFPSAPGISLEFNSAGKAIFSRVTGENVGRRLAIVLDGKVHSAPNIKERIRGAASITGNFTNEQARDLQIVLQAGALPAPLEIVEERTVGPSLGMDSIRRGVRAAITGGIAVAVFMVLYYNLSGLLAVGALALNLVILMAALAGLRGTLTLPGIAGIILTIGMAVDANVLIFERIREEIGAGKTIRKAIADGYSRAFITILDANLTTLITAAVLYQFGTGPIKGFAVTLSLGILASMFTAIFVTRVIYDVITSMRTVTKLSI
ncbi:MAG: protein translocase subunit SecD [bacterium]